MDSGLRILSIEVLNKEKPTCMTINATIKQIYTRSFHVQMDGPHLPAFSAIFTPTKSMMEEAASDKLLMRLP